MNNTEMEQRLAEALKKTAPNDVDGVLSRCEERTGTEKKMTKTTTNRRWISLAAACLAVVLLVSGGLVFRQENAVASVVSLDVNPSIELNVNKREKVLSCRALNEDARKLLEDMNGGADLEGVKLEVVSADVEGSTAKVYLSLTDTTGSLFGDAAPDMYDSWSLDYAGFGRGARSYGCSTLDYDPNTHTATYFLQIDDLNGKHIPAGAFRFSFNQLLIGREKREGVPITADLSAVPKNAPTENHDINGLSGLDISMYEDMHDYDFLVPQGNLWQSENGVCALIAAGWRNGELHLHYRTDGSLSLGNHADFSTLHLADGTKLMCDYTVTYKDFDNDTDYTEYVFPMAYKDVAGCTLTGDLYTASNLMDGSWAVSFQLTQ